MRVPLTRDDGGQERTEVFAVAKGMGDILFRTPLTMKKRETKSHVEGRLSNAQSGHVNSLLVVKSTVSEWSSNLMSSGST